MPGVRYEASGTSGDVPLQQAFLLGSNLGGSNQAIYAGDLCVLTTNATWNPAAGGQPSVPVIRQLMSGDLAALGSGILGVVIDNIATNANGIINGRPTFGQAFPSQVVFSMPAPSARVPIDIPSGRQRMPVILASGANWFRAKLNTTFAAGATHALDGTQAGIAIVVGPTGVNNYVVDPAATVKCVVIIKPDETDVNYNVASGGGVVFFQFLPTFYQLQLGTTYTT